MTLILAADPTSQVCVALSGWAYPLSRDSITLRDLYDLQHKSKAKRKPQPYPRPWDKPSRNFGRGTSMTPDKWRELRARAN